MSKRHEFALIAQGGASNARRVASGLVEAIDECRAQGCSDRECPAVFLINHQLTHLLTGGFDYAVADAAMNKRWVEATAACELYSRLNDGFRSSGSEHRERNGQQFSVLGPIEDPKCPSRGPGAKWKIQFHDGTRLDAFEDEIAAPEPHVERPRATA